MRRWAPVVLAACGSKIAPDTVEPPKPVCIAASARAPTTGNLATVDITTGKVDVITASVCKG